MTGSERPDVQGPTAALLGGPGRPSQPMFDDADPADVAEQLRDARVPDDLSPEDLFTTPLEASEADALEQSRVDVTDDDDEQRG